MKFTSIPTTALLTALAVGTTLSAQQQVSVTPKKDNTIFAFDPLASNGAGSRFFCGADVASGVRRGLIAFDVAAAVPPGSTILTAQLQLTIAQTRAVDQSVTVHRLTSDWGESNSIAGGGQGGGAIAAPGDATWTDAFTPTVAWTAAGGDFVAAPSASTICGSFGTFTWSSSQMVADVQGWLDSPAQSFGWLVATDERSLQTARAFHSREAASPSDQPHLVITYTPPSARVQSFGAGCNGGGAAPLTLGTIGLPTIPNPSFAFTLSGGPAAGLKAIDYFAALLPGPIPIGGGCALWGDFTTFVDGVVTTGTTPLGIPNNASLYGVQFAAQGLAYDPVTASFATSNGLLLHLGQ